MRKDDFVLVFFSEIVEPFNHSLELDGMEKVTEVGLEIYPVEDLRAVFVRLALRMRNRLAETDAQQSEMNLLAREITAMQNMRRYFFSFMIYSKKWESWKNFYVFCFPPARIDFALAFFFHKGCNFTARLRFFLLDERSFA